MSPPRPSTLARKSFAGTAALAVVVMQATYWICPCSLASAAARRDCCQAARTLCRCSQGLGALGKNCCCGLERSAEPPQDEGCLCTTTARELAATAPATPEPLQHPDAAHFLAYGPAHSGLHGVPWATAFDRARSTGPPGPPLHALLCVWRN